MGAYRTNPKDPMICHLVVNIADLDQCLHDIDRYSLSKLPRATAKPKARAGIMLAPV